MTSGKKLPTLFQPRGEIFLTAIVRGEEKYILLYDEASRKEALRTVGRWAADPELSFTWYDAAGMSQKIRG
jgi:hypothetical protein